MSSTVNVYFKRFFKEYFSIDLVRFENYHVQNIPHSKFVDHAQNNKLFSWLQFNEQRDDIKMWLKEQWASECHFILRIVSKKISISTQKKTVRPCFVGYLQNGRRMASPHCMEIVRIMWHNLYPMPIRWH